MPVWQWLLDAAGALLVLVLFYGLGLIVRRRLLSRHGGTFELSYRVRQEHAGRGWLLGLGRYSGESLRVVPATSRCGPDPSGCSSAPRSPSSAAAAPEGAEQMSLYPEHVVLSCSTPTGTSSWPCRPPR